MDDKGIKQISMARAGRRRDRDRNSEYERVDVTIPGPAGEDYPLDSGTRTLLPV
jgi:hypothetical protein